MSSIPQNKAELLSAIRQAFDKILHEYRTLDPALVRECEIAGNIQGTRINVADTLAYLIGWQNLVLKWHYKKQHHQAVDFPDTGYNWNELGKLATRFHRQYQDWHYTDLLQQFITTTEAVISLVESLSNEQLYAENWYNRWTLGRMIQLNSASPMKNILARLRKFKKQSAV